MRGEIRFVQIGERKERVYPRIAIKDIRGRRIVELDIAAVQLTHPREVEELIEFLQTAREAFYPFDRSIGAHFDDARVVQDELPPTPKQLEDGLH